MTAEPQDTGQRWRARPVLAGTLRAVLLAVPLVASTGAVFVVSRLLPPGAAATWWGLSTLLVTALAVAVAMERGTRRLLPIALLLKLSMIFPDRAPSRLKLARSAAVRTPKNELLWNGTETEPTSTAELVLNLVAALGSHDRRTRGHSERVRLLCDMLAEELKLDADARDRLRWSALLHDVGKMKVSTAILNKPGRLDAREFERIKQHPTAGAQLAAPLLPWLGEWGDGIVDHHEKYDGSGYPSGKAGTQISTAGRLIGLIDAFETMTAARPYKKAMATKAAREELARCAGTHFDPLMVRAFLAISLPRVLWAMGPLSFLFQLPFLRPLADAGVRAGASAPHAAAAALTSGAAGAAVIVSGGLGGVIAPGATGMAELQTPTLASAPHSAPYSLLDRVRRTPPADPVDPVTQVVVPPAAAPVTEGAPEPADQLSAPAGGGGTTGAARPAPASAPAAQADIPAGSLTQPSDPAAPAQPAPDRPAPADPAPAEEQPPVDEPAPAPVVEPAEPDQPAEPDAPGTEQLPPAQPLAEAQPAEQVAPAQPPPVEPVEPAQPVQPPVVVDPGPTTPTPAAADPPGDSTGGTTTPGTTPGTGTGTGTGDDGTTDPTAPAPNPQISAGILAGPADVVDSRTSTFTFATGTTWQCQVLGNGAGNGSNYKACSSPYELTVVDDGAHQLNVRDGSGNVYSWKWTVVEPTVSASGAFDPVPIDLTLSPAPPAMHPGLPLMALVMALFAPAAAVVRRLRASRS